MDDNQFCSWLMFVTQQITQLRNSTADTTNAGPRFHETNTHTTDDEGFLRWMGHRGQEAQELETAWSAEDLKETRLEHSRQKLRRENQELKTLLRYIRDEISKLGV
jgi:hypothetical protein